MRIAAGADHAGVQHKNRIVEALRELGHEVEDFGTHGEDAVDYPDFAAAVARSVADGRADRGVLVCATGIGMSMAANRVRGVRAALCNDGYSAEMCRRHNNANVLCLGGRVRSWDEVLAILKTWLETPFEGGRHDRRTAKLDEIRP